MGQSFNKQKRCAPTAYLELSGVRRIFSYNFIRINGDFAEWYKCSMYFSVVQISVIEIPVLITEIYVL